MELELTTGVKKHNSIDDTNIIDNNSIINKIKNSNKIIENITINNTCNKKKYYILGHDNVYPIE